MKILAWLGRHATAALALGAFVGLIMPSLAELLRGMLPVLVFLFTAISLLKIDRGTFVPLWKKPALPALVIGWCVILVPLLVGAVLQVAPLPKGLAQAIIIWAASPPMTAAIVFAVLLGLDTSLASGVALSSIFIVPLTGPLLCLALAGLPIGIDAPVLIGRVAAFIGAAAAAAFLVRRVVGHERLARNHDAVNGVIIVTLIAYAAALTAGVGAEFAMHPGRILLFTAAGFATNILVQLVTALLFVRFGVKLSVTSALLAGNRNMSVLCAGLGTAATAEIMLFFALSHVAVYTLPWLFGRCYRWVAMRSDVSAVQERVVPASTEKVIWTSGAEPEQSMSRSLRRDLVG
jgi:BASS family bile acid:Na+ symporter